MSQPSRRNRHVFARRQRGFSLIEVLISILVLGLGLLGLAMLQVTNLRLTQSANSRTVASNLAYEIMDDIRANRIYAINYAGTIAAAKDAKSGCSHVGAVSSSTQKADYACRLLKTLGDSAAANIEVAMGDRMSTVTVTITWDDARRWQPGALGSSVSVRTQL